MISTVAEWPEFPSWKWKCTDELFYRKYLLVTGFTPMLHRAAINCRRAWVIWFTIEDYLSRHSADSTPLPGLNWGYRNPLTFNDEGVEQRKSYWRLRGPLRLQMLEQQVRHKPGWMQYCARKSDPWWIWASMDDDFNSAGALGYLFELSKCDQSTRADGYSCSIARRTKPSQNLAGVLGLKLEKSQP